MAKQYCIVEFYSESEESNPVDVVPHTWIDFNTKYVSWPPKTGTAVRSAVKKRHPPSPNWSLHRFTRVLAECGEFYLTNFLMFQKLVYVLVYVCIALMYFLKLETYTEALKKLKKSEETSNLESEAEVIDGPLTKKTRLREAKKRRTSISSNSSRESSVSSVEDHDHVTAPSFPSLSLVGTSVPGIHLKFTKNVI